MSNPCGKLGVGQWCKACQVTHPKQRVVKAVVANTKLTPREKQVVKLIGEDFTNKLIAMKLDISVNTVHFHLLRAYKKLDVTTRGGAIATAIRQGIV